MDIQQAIATVVAQNSLTRGEMTAVMRSIMTGECTDAQIAGFLIGLRMKGETVSEIAGAATVMRELMTPVRINAANAIDIVGTGGDGARIFNVSTASSVVCAAAGATVAKHGNRSVSSSSGAADVLAAAGVDLTLDAAGVARCIEEVGIGFMFAVNHHAAMRYAIGPRKELATRTIFNVLGPLTNPAGVKRQLLGVFSQALLRPLVEVLGELGSRHVLAVHSDDGLDEISIAAPTTVVELRDGAISEYRIAPEDFAIERAKLDGLRVDGAEQSLQVVNALLSGACGPAADMVALNAGAALYVAGKAEDVAGGVALAQKTLASGAGAEKLAELAKFSQGLAES